VIIHKAASRRRHFTIVDNATLQDARLSYRARGVLAYLLSLPDGWVTDHRKLASFAVEGERAVLAALKELETHGYLIRRRFQDPTTGRWRTDTELVEVPDVSPQVAPSGGFRDSVNRDSVNRDSYQRLKEKTDIRSSRGDDLRLVVATLEQATGRKISNDDARKAVALAVGGRTVANPVAYADAVIRRDRDPSRFAPTRTPPFVCEVLAWRPDEPETKPLG
jgi:hypothetical protein